MKTLRFQLDAAHISYKLAIVTNNHREKVLQQRRINKLRVLINKEFEKYSKAA